VKHFLLATLLVACSALPSVGQTAPQSAAVLALKGQLLRVLTGKDTAGFLALVGSAGMTFGADGDIQFKPQVAEQLDQKLDLYCYLFDSKCFTRETARKRQAPPCSVYDLVRKTNGWSMEYELPPDGNTSEVALVLRPNQEFCSNGKDPVAFIYSEFPEGWKLIAIVPV
jgi:hypothetical protein